MASELRLATMHDVPAIMAVLAVVQGKSDTGKKLGSLIESELAIRFAIHEDRGYMYDNVFMFFEIGSLWYSERRTLFEQMVLKLGKMTGTFADVVAQFDIIAKRHNCTAVVVGDSQARTMVHRYEAAGYKQSAIQLYKEVA